MKILIAKGAEFIVSAVAVSIVVDAILVVDDDIVVVVVVVAALERIMLLGAIIGIWGCPL